MWKTRMKYIVFLCVMAGIVSGCSGKAAEQSVLAGQENSKEVSATEEVIRTEQPVVEETAEVPVSMGATEVPEEKTNTAEWIYDAQNHRLTIRGTGESHDRELIVPVDCSDCKYHLNSLPYLEGIDSWKKQEKVQKSIKEVVVEQGITTLNMAAFADLPNLEKVTIPDSVEKIDDYVFYNCKSLKKITIPDSVTSIGKECFGECESLEKISFGKKVKAIGDGSFLKCQSLRQIVVAPESKFFICKKGGLYQQKEKVLYFYYDCFKKANIEKDTKRIGTFAFADHNELQEVHIPASVTVIGGGAFYQCKNLRKVIFAQKSKCKKIESYNSKRDVHGCFSYCEKLAKLDFPKSLRSIGVYGLMSCTSLKNVRFPEGFRFIGSHCLSDCTSLKRVYFGKSFEGYLDYKQDVSDGYKAEDARLNRWFVNDTRSLKEIKVSKKNPFFSTENGVMYDKKKEVLYVYPEGKKDIKFKIPKSVRKIRAWAFDQCNHLRTVEIFGQKTEIQSTVFWKNTNLKSVKIYGEGTKLEEESFYQCKKLKSVAVYGEKSWIASKAFKRCKNIKSVTISGKKTEIEPKAFGQSKNFTIYGKEDSEAQKFAKDYNKKFVVIKKIKYPVAYLLIEILLY